MKILVLLGVGSTYFTKGIVESLIRNGSEFDLRLVDIDLKCLYIALKLSRRLVNESDAPIKISGSENREEVLPGAERVISTIGLCTGVTWWHHHLAGWIGLPADAVLESTALFNGSGIHPLSFGELSPGITAILQRIIGIQELTVDAAISGDRQLVLKALIAGLTVKTRPEAEKMLDVIIDTHREFLPDYYF